MMWVLELMDMDRTSSPKARNPGLLQMYLAVIGIWVLSIQTGVPVEDYKGSWGWVCLLWRLPHCLTGLWPELPAAVGDKVVE